MNSGSEVETDSIRKAVLDAFLQLIAAVNALDVDAWSTYYSRDNFLSTIAGTDYSNTRDEWIAMIRGYFAQRTKQLVDPQLIRVAPLTNELALLTSEERCEMQLKTGETINTAHVFTMLWKKEGEDWKIIHSHESWKNA